MIHSERPCRVRVFDVAADAFTHRQTVIVREQSNKKLLEHHVVRQARTFGRCGKIHSNPLSVGAPLPTVAEGEVSSNGASPEVRS